MKVWAFAGRDGELERLNDVLSDPTRPAVVLTGPAGVGKTRLGLELLERASKAGMATARVMATGTNTELPFSAASALIPDGEFWTVREPIELARRLADAVAERTAGQRLAVLVDDAHLLDDGSAALIQQLVMRNLAFIIVTVRTGERVPGPIMAFWREDLAARIELEPVSATGIEQIVSTALGGPLAGSLVTSLTRQTQGNLLFVRELVDGALADGVIRQEGGIWQLVGTLQPTHLLVELIQGRFAGIEPAERAVLDVLAVGEPLSGIELRPFTTELVLEQLEQRGIISTSLTNDGLTVALAHPLYGEVLRAELSASRMQRITRQLAEMAEATNSDQPDNLLRIGSWRLRCGGGRPEVLLAASRVAFQRFDNALAENLAAAAVSANAGFDAQVFLAELIAMRGDRTAADARLVELWAAATDDLERRQVALVRADNAILMDLTRAVEICDESIAAISDPLLAVEIRARRAWGMLYVRGPRAAWDATESLPVDGPSVTEAIAIRAGRAFALTHLGPAEPALELIAVNEQAHRSSLTEFHWPLSVHDFFRCEALAGAGRFREMERIAIAAYRTAVDEGSRRGSGWVAYSVATALSERGRVQSAVRYAREACGLFSKADEPLPLSQALLCLAYTSAIAGDQESATNALLRFDGMDVTRSIAWHWGGMHYARAWAAAASGDLPVARRHFEQEVEHSLMCGDHTRASSALHGLVRIGHPKQAVAGLRDLVPVVRGELTAIRAAHAEALVDNDAVGLEAVSAAFENLGADLLAAEVSADAAVVWRRAGEMRHASAAEHRSAQLLERCEQPVTPATQRVETRARLTSAERNTALLASEGRSNKDIATELIVSVRTVESRLQHVYTKLGITRRSDLRAALRPQR